MGTYVPGRGFLPRATMPKGKPVRGMKKLTYKPEYDNPALAKKKPARRKKSTRKTSKVTMATKRTVIRPKKRLPRMKKPWWQFW